MGNYLLAYTGGKMGETPQERDAQLKAWGEWFGTLGSAVVDGGAPFGPSTAVRSDGSTAATTMGLSGYSIIQADTLDLAAKLAADCPVLANGGRVEVFESLPM